MPSPPEKPDRRLSPRTTILDVARAAGVHASTVSRALNPATRGMVTEAVAQRVMAAAEQLGWRPSVLAAGLRTRRTRTVGILVPDLVNPVFPPIVRAAETRFAEAGYVALVANTDTDPAREALLIERMAAHLVDGLMLASAAQGSRALDLCTRWGIPVVLINRRLPAAGVPAVVNDDVLGMMLAVRHLAALGHRRIAHIAGPPGVSTAMDRRRGFELAAAEAGIGADIIVTAPAYTEAAGRHAAEEVLRGPPVTAIAAANDMLCLGVYEALAAAGLQVGRDMSVTGFNDMPFVDRISPPLTTVRIQHAEMGRQAADVLLAELGGQPDPARDITLAPLLVVRGSSAPPGARRP